MKHSLKYNNVRFIMTMGHLWINLGIAGCLLVWFGYVADIKFLYAPFYNEGTGLQTLFLAFLMLSTVKSNSIYGATHYTNAVSWSVALYILMAWFTDINIEIDNFLRSLRPLNTDNNIHLTHGFTSELALFAVAVVQIIKPYGYHALRSWILFVAAFIPFNIAIAYTVGNTFVINYMGFWSMIIIGLLIWGILFLQTHRRHLRYLVCDPMILRIFLLTAFAVIVVETAGLITMTWIETTDAYPSHWPALILALGWISLAAVIVANYLTSGITNQNRKLIQEKHLLATLDRLTQTKNRLGFSEILSERDITKDAGIILCDIDDFKRINDTYGHDAGDKVLCEFARVLNQHSRSTDHVVRWGGEEFLIFTTNATPTGITTYTEKLRKAVTEIKFEFDSELVITASFGATIIGPRVVFDDGVRIADEKLYYAKRNGKNRVVDDSIDHEVLIV